MNEENQPDDAPVKRAYSSPARAEQADRTRATIRAAAVRLFLRDGYAATSMKAVAVEAGVGERTPYVVFGTKRDLLLDCLSAAVARDDLPDRDTLAAAVTDPDPEQAVRRVAGVAAVLLERVGPLVALSLEAGGADPDLRAANDASERGAFEAQRDVASALAERGVLGEGLDAAGAADLLYALSSPQVHHLLRTKRGWSAERYRDWLADTLVAQLL